MAETELERAERRVREAQARLQTLRTREAQKQRKLDTRRKVILGGALVDLADRDDAALAMVERLLRNLSRDLDRAAFEGWEVRGIGERQAQASKGELAETAAPGPAAHPAEEAVPEEAAETGLDGAVGDASVPAIQEPEPAAEVERPRLLKPTTSGEEIRRQMRAQDEADRAAGLNSTEQRQARLRELTATPLKGRAE